MRESTISVIRALLDCGVLVRSQPWLHGQQTNIRKTVIIKWRIQIKSLLMLGIESKSCKYIYGARVLSWAPMISAISARSD
jgi:hypothetical protein